MKKGFTILLAAICVSTLAGGCSGNAQNSPAASAAAPSAAQPETSQQASADAPAQTSAPSEATAPYEFTMYGNLAAQLTDADKALFDTLGQQTNTKITIQLPPSSDYMQSLTVMMAGGDYPDLVLFPDNTNTVFMDGVRNGAILPVNSYIANEPNLMKYTYDISWKSLQVLSDGQIWGIPRTSIARADGLIIRQDWLDTLGISMTEGQPVTLDDFTKILQAFTNNDPDGNGVKDTYGLGISTEDGILSVPPQIAWAYGLIGWQQYPNEDYKYMNLQYSKKSDNFKQALTYLNGLWKQGLIDPDWPTTNSVALTQRVAQGIDGVYGEFSGWLPDRQATAQQANPNLKFSYIVSLVQNAGDKGQGGSFSTGYWGEWCLMNTAKDPQKIADVLDYMLSDDFWPTVNYGVEGVAWTNDANNNKIAVPDANYTAGRGVLRRNNAPEFFVGLTTAVDQRDRILNLINICINQSVFSMDAGFRPAEADDPAYIDATNAYNVAVSKIIVGDLPISDYDTELDKWYQAGGQTYIEQMNAGIDASQQ